MTVNQVVHNNPPLESTFQSSPQFHNLHRMFEITCTILLNIAYIIYKAELKFMQIRYDYEFSIFVNHILLNFTLLTEI